MRRRIAAIILFVCMAGLLAGLAKEAAHAANGPTANVFDGNVYLLLTDKNNYVMQVVAENKGADFYGTVQVIFQASRSVGNCAYNTEIALPAQGRKEFTLTVPKRAVDVTRAECRLNFLDAKGKLVQSIPLKDLMHEASGVSVGILSDDYSSLTYMDAGGGSIYVRGDVYPIHLNHLDKDNLKGYLNGLYFLVIDQFNVSSLKEEDIRAIEQWVKDGGWLILGTGAYAEQTLSGFDEDFMDMRLDEILGPGEENIVSKNSDRYGSYSNYANGKVDFSQMTFAQLDYGRLGYSSESQENPAVYRAVDKGAVAVYFCSLGDEQLRKLDNYAVEYIYEELMYQSQSYYTSFSRDSDMDSVGQRLLAYIGNRDSNVDFSVLRLLIVVYVILAGPVLYLILRKCKKSEWYWVGVPALGLTFILGVFLMGRNARVNETRMYSVTVQKADEERMDTYFLAYHSGIKPWRVLMREGYEYAGPGWNGYEGKYFLDTDDYFYTVDYDSRGLYVGEKPQENFESGFFYAGGHTQRRGVITGANIQSDPSVRGCMMGSLTNDTDCDLAYMAVWYEQEIMVIENVKAGETLDLQQTLKDGRCVYQSRNVANVRDLALHSAISIYSTAKQERRYSEDDIAALLIGLGVANEENPRPGDWDYAIIAGLIKDCEKVTAGKCKETSYGCLYGYAKTEG